MRTAFINDLITQARANPKVFLVVGDLGYSVVEPFAAEFPERYLNAGVAEQNMTTVAAGLASEGYHVFTYSIANFPTLRCLEQIRNDVCYHNLPVTVVAVGAGMAYGNLGYSHHAVQDLAVMRALPSLTAYSPADPGETRECLKLILERGRPSYLRLGKAGEQVLHGVPGVASGLLEVRAGTAPIAFAATGSILKSALEAANRLHEKGLEVAVYSCPVLSAEPPANFAPLWRHQTVLAVEEHGAVGGFGSFLKELAPAGVQVRICAIGKETFSLVGSQAFLRREAGLDGEGLAKLLSSMV